MQSSRQRKAKITWRRTINVRTKAKFTFRTISGKVLVKFEAKTYALSDLEPAYNSENDPLFKN